MPDNCGMSRRALIEPDPGRGTLWIVELSAPMV